MRLVILFVTLMMFALVGCVKSDEGAAFAANYKGAFMRTDGSPLGDPIVANVTLDFTKNTVNGSSDSPHYPAICAGSFTISQSKITVSNTCYFTADFDWTLIFKGEYYYKQNGNHLRIWRTYENGWQDIYELTKVE